VNQSSNDRIIAHRASKPRLRIGHAGTLDPLADGVLPLALGEATKTVAFMMDSRKRYRFTVQWGEATTTDDREGAVLATSDHTPTQAAIEAALPAFTGSIQQRPPVFSAIKQQGRRAYDRAREGETVIIPTREVQVHALTLLSHTPERRQSVLEMECGKGTYVRSLARDLGECLGTHAHVATLTRTACGVFTLDHAISLEKLEKAVHSAALDGLVYPLTTVLDDIPELPLSGTLIDRLRHGQRIPVAELPELPASKTGQYQVCDSGVLVVIVAVKEQVLASVRGFTLN
jgi:tRNA pseudouridine55 synthase